MLALGTISFLCFGSIFFLPEKAGQVSSWLGLYHQDQVSHICNSNLNNNFQTAGGKVKVVADALQVCDYFPVAHFFYGQAGVNICPKVPNIHPCLTNKSYKIG